MFVLKQWYCEMPLVLHPGKCPYGFIFALRVLVVFFMPSKHSLTEVTHHQMVQYQRERCSNAEKGAVPKRKVAVPWNGAVPYFAFLQKVLDKSFFGSSSLYLFNQAVRT